MSPGRLAVLPRSAGAHRGAAGVGVDSIHGERARAQLGDGAVAADAAGVDASGGLIEDHFCGVFDIRWSRWWQGRIQPGLDVTLQAGRITSQRTLINRSAAGVGVVPGEDQRARALFGERAAAAHVSGVGASDGLVENDGAVVDNIPLHAGGVALENACADGGAARVAIGSRDDQRAGVLLGDRDRPGEDGRGGGNRKLAGRRAAEDDAVRERRQRARQVNRAAIDRRIDRDRIDARRAVGIDHGLAQRACTGVVVVCNCENRRLQRGSRQPTRRQCGGQDVNRRYLPARKDGHLIEFPRNRCRRRAHR